MCLNVHTYVFIRSQQNLFCACNRTIMQQQSISKFFASKKKPVQDVANKSREQFSSPLSPHDTVDLTGENETSSGAKFVPLSLSQKSAFNAQEFLRKRISSEVDLSDNQTSKFRRIVLGVTRNLPNMSEYPDDGIEDIDVHQAQQEQVSPTKVASMSSKSSPFTPLEKQVLAIREKYPDSLLMVECGYRMRFFGDDAVTAASVLGVWAHKDHNFMVASVPTHRAIFHCQRLLSAGLKVGIVRQTETAAIRKGNKGSSSQTFERNVVGVFTAGTLIDDDDPAFDGLITSTNNLRAASKEEGSGDEEEEDALDNEDGNTIDITAIKQADSITQDEWIASYFEDTCSSFEQDTSTSNRHSSNGNSTVDLIADDIPSYEEKIGALVAVCVRAHSVWVRTFSLDTVHQSLADYLEMLKPTEIVFPDNLSSPSQEIIGNYFAQERQRRESAQPVSESSQDQLDAMTGTVSNNQGNKLMNRIKLLPRQLYQETNIAKNSIPGDKGRTWSQELSTIAQKALLGLRHYLQEFHLESTLLDPQTNVYESVVVAAAPTGISAEDTTKPSSAVSSSCHTSEQWQEPSFPLDGVTVRDLELFDSFSNANEQLRGLGKLLRYQQQYLFHQEKVCHRQRPLQSSSARHNNNSSSQLLAQHSLLPGGLFGLLDRCLSVYGRRTLRQWLLNPLNEREAIVSRQQTIAWLLPAFSASAAVQSMDTNDGDTSHTWRSLVKDFVHSIQDMLKKAPDIEKMLTSLQFNRISPVRLTVLLNLAMRMSVLHVSHLHRTQAADDTTLAANENKGDAKSNLLAAYLPTWLKRQLQRTNFLELATVATHYNSRISIANSHNNSSSHHAAFAASVGSDYDADRINHESLTGFFDAELENSFPALLALRREKHVIEAGFVDELQQIRRELKKPQLKYTSLRSGPLSSIDHLIELPIAEEKKAPEHWIKVNATKQMVRFHVPKVLQWQEKWYRLRDECKLAGKDAWQSFASEVKDAIHASLRLAIVVLGNLDAMLSLTQVAASPGYVCPLYSDPIGAANATSCREMHIIDGRHPVLERRFADSETPYLPNDVHLGNVDTEGDNDDGSVQLNMKRRRRMVQIITGPNLGGKSSYCRMVALIALMGQLGSFVPATEARLVVFDNILTRMGSEDDLQSGRSTFLCELIRTNTILRHATPRSLVLIDELGRGTATHDGFAIAQATLWHMLRHTRCMTLFITHFHHLQQQEPSDQDQDQLETAGVVQSHMSYLERVLDATTGEAEITFLYKLVETVASSSSSSVSVASSSYGINVARLAGIKKSILDRAMVKAKEMQLQMDASMSH